MVSKSFLFLTTLLIGACQANRNFAAVLLADDFDSYADTAAMNAAWNEGPTGAGALDSAFGNSGQSLFHPGGTTQKRTFTPTIATDASPIVWSFDLYDDAVPNKRNTGGLRDNGGGAPLTALLEMGRYNSIFNPETSSLVSGYGLRTAFLGGPAAAAGWLTFETNPPQQAGWHTFSATIGDTNILWELDLQADGSIDAFRNTPLSTGANRAYNVARFGGPSDVASAGGAVNFDNLSISQSEFAPIVYQGVLNDGVTQFDSVSSSGTEDDPATARFWTFTGNQGDVVRIEALRNEFDLDASLWVYEGVFTSTSQFAGGSEDGFDFGDPGFLDFADDEIPHPGPFGDARSIVTLTLPGTGQYTVAVTNFASGPNDGGDGLFDYGITLTTVPEPASVALAVAAIGCLPLIRRKHRLGFYESGCLDDSRG